MISEGAAVVRSLTIGSVVLGVILVSASTLAGQDLRVAIDPPGQLIKQVPSSLEIRIVASSRDMQGQPKLTIPSVPGLTLTRTNFTRRMQHSSNRQVVSTFFVRYAIEASQVGRFTLPSIQAEWDGKVGASDPMTLSVVEPPRNDDIASLVMTVAKQSVYPGEPNRVTLRFRILESYRDSEFDIRHLPFPSGVDTKTIMPDDNAQQVRTSLGNLYFRTTTEELAGKVYIAYVMDFDVRTDRPGRVNLSGLTWPVTVYQLNQRLFATANPMSYTVKPFPSDPPPSFSGAVGRYTFRADADIPSEIRVLDPIDVMLTISGEPLDDSLVAPDLEQQPDIANAFRVMESKDPAQRSSTSKTFQVALRPQNAGEQTIPPIQFTYFDLGQEDFVTLASRPIPISVMGGNLVEGGSQTSPGSTADPREDDALQVNQTQLAPMKPVSAIKPAPKLSLAMLAAPGAGALAIVLVLLLAGLGQRKARRVEHQERQWEAQAKQRYREAGRTDDSIAALDGTLQALALLIASRTGIMIQHPTASDAERWVSEGGLPLELGENLATLTRIRDQIRYGGGDGVEWREGSHSLWKKIHALELKS